SRGDAVPPAPILNVTGHNTPRIVLPYRCPNGSTILLDDETEEPFPRDLYPNITYKQTGIIDPTSNLPLYEAYAFGDELLSRPSGMLLGPLSINESFALISVTLPIMDNDNPGFNLGFLTVVASA